MVNFGENTKIKKAGNLNSGRRYNINCNDWVMTKFGPKIELFDHIDSWVGDWVAGVSLFGRKYSQSYGKY